MDELLIKLNFRHCGDLLETTLLMRILVKINNMSLQQTRITEIIHYINIIGIVSSTKHHKHSVSADQSSKIFYQSNNFGLSNYFPSTQTTPAHNTKL